MPSLKSALAVLAMTLGSSGTTHMIMASPPPYGDPSTSPLAADGSDFPCKATSTSGGSVTSMTIGSPQTLSFNGAAVHGGGSCQVSLTTDNPATKSSKWMVIHSIEGGCPAKGQSGNMPDPSGGIEPNLYPDPDKYSFAIPQGINPGTYTLAWTWFNKIGNREMYMNCASIKVTGGSGKKRSTVVQRRGTTVAFPSMFLANIGNGCTTAEGGDLKFPNPGASVETNAGYIPMAPVGNCAGASGGASSSSSSSDTGSSTGSSPGSSSGSTQAESSTPPSSMALAAPVIGTPSSAIAPPAATDAASTSPSTSSCSSPGQSVCSPDGTQVGTCSQARTVTWVKLASGTTCAGGNVVVEKRSVKFVGGVV